MKKAVLYITALLGLILIPSMVSTHIGSVFLPEGCGSCHVGHGMSNEPMLSASQEDACYQCHGSADKKSVMIASGRLSPAASLPDIEAEFRKLFRHPVEKNGEHSPDERLPSFSKSQTTHAECVDCHNPHQRGHFGVGDPAGVSGYSLSGQYLEEATQEYEICLKCHSEVIGGRSEADLRAQFAPAVTSMHPVTRPTSGKGQVSLTSYPRGSAMMNCSDCHRSEDPNGPRGPHGSMYKFMLSGNYSIDARADESPLAYQFCYSCHDRSSIMSNESFPLHREHIVGDPFKGIAGTSCYTCHASHSSERNPYLIRFNREAVSEVQPGNLMEYRSLGNKSGECYLVCHGKSHNPARY